MSYFFFVTHNKKFFEYLWEGDTKYDNAITFAQNIHLTFSRGKNWREELKLQKVLRSEVGVKYLSFLGSNWINRSLNALTTTTTTIYVEFHCLFKLKRKKRVGIFCLRFPKYVSRFLFSHITLKKLSLPLTLSPLPSPSLSLFPSLSLSFCLFLSHSYPFPLSLSFCHTLSLSHTHSPLFQLFFVASLSISFTLTFPSPFTQSKQFYRRKVIIFWRLLKVLLREKT